MPRGRQKKANKFTRTEICRRSRKKRKQEDPKGYEEKLAVQRKKKQYNKDKNKPHFMFKTQKSSLLSYYKKELKKKTFLKIITHSKDVNTSW